VLRDLQAMRQESSRLLQHRPSRHQSTSDEAAPPEFRQVLVATLFQTIFFFVFKIEVYSTFNTLEARDAPDIRPAGYPAR
jgi:hypothetical protein